MPLHLGPKVWLAAGVFFLICAIGLTIRDARFLAGARYRDARVLSSERVFHNGRRPYTDYHLVVTYADQTGTEYHCAVTTSAPHTLLQIAYRPEDPSACELPPSVERDITTMGLSALMFCLVSPPLWFLFYIIRAMQPRPHAPPHTAR